MKVKQIPYKSPNLSPYAEGWVGTIKRDCLDKFYVFGKDHFKYLINEYVDYYNTVRPHSGLDNKCIDYVPEKLDGDIVCNARLSGVIRHSGLRSASWEDKGVILFSFSPSYSFFLSMKSNHLIK